MKLSNLIKQYINSWQTKVSESKDSFTTLDPDLIKKILLLIRGEDYFDQVFKPYIKKFDRKKISITDIYIDSAKDGDHINYYLFFDIVYDKENMKRENVAGEVLELFNYIAATYDQFTIDNVKKFYEEVQIDVMYALERPKNRSELFLDVIEKLNLNTSDDLKVWLKLR